VCDLSRLDEVESLFDTVMPDLVVMAASPPGHPGTPQERRNSLIDNLAIHLAVCEAMVGVSDGCRLVALGSSTAYGDGNEIRDPRGVMAPRTFKGAIKAAESLTVSTMSWVHHFPCTELRIFCAYGPWMSHGRVLTRLLKAALTSTRVPLSAAPLPRDWVHHEDIARACLSAAEINTREPTVFNLCSGRLRDVREVATILEAITGRELIAEGAYPGPDRMGTVMPGMRPTAEHGFSWQPHIELEAGIEACWRWAQTEAGRRYLLADG
jgi:nucleoside-diphosphate-sugar epimerase